MVKILISTVNLSNLNLILGNFNLILGNFNLIQLLFIFLKNLSTFNL